MKIFNNNKGQATFENFKSLAVAIAGLAILLVVSFLIMSEGKEQAVEDASTISFTNQTVTITVDANNRIDPSCNPDSALSITEVWNTSTGNVTADPAGNRDILLLNSGNYTITGNLLNVSDDLMPVADTGIATTINVSFGCSIRSHAFNATSTLQNATNDIPGWVPLIVIAVIGSTLLGLVGLFMRRR